MPTPTPTPTRTPTRSTNHTPGLTNLTPENTIIIGNRALRSTPKRLADRQRAGRVTETSPTKKTARRNDAVGGSLRSIGGTLKDKDDPFSDPTAVIGRSVPIQGAGKGFRLHGSVPPIPSRTASVANGYTKPETIGTGIAQQQPQTQTQTRTTKKDSERQVIIDLEAEVEELKNKNKDLEDRVKHLTTELNQLNDKGDRLSNSGLNLGSFSDALPRVVQGGSSGRQLQGLLEAREKCRAALLKQRDRERESMRQILRQKGKEI